MHPAQCSIMWPPFGPHVAHLARELPQPDSARGAQVCGVSPARKTTTPWSGRPRSSEKKTPMATNDEPRAQPQKDLDAWVTGGEPMTGPQACAGRKAHPRLI